VYDNSHIQGSNPVGAMIVAGPEGFRKNQYRKFNIRSAELAPGDDYGMMREVLTRRFRRLIADSPRTAAGGTIESNSEPPAPVTSLLMGRSAPKMPAARRRLASSLSPPPSLSLPRRGEEQAVAAAELPSPARHNGEAETEAQAGDDSDTAESPWPDLVIVDAVRASLPPCGRFSPGLA